MAAEPVRSAGADGRATTPRADRRGALVLLAAPLAFLALFFGLPLARTLGAALDAPAAWTWLASPYVQGRLRVALLQAGLSVAATFAVAAPLAWLHHRRRIPWSRAHLALHAAPFVLPVFVIVYGIQLVLGPRGLVHELAGIDVLSAAGPLAAIVLAHAYYNYGFAARLLHVALDRRPRRLEAAARTLGASEAGAFLRVTLPLLAPTLAGIALLVFLFAFSSFGVVLFLGEGRISTLETLLYQNLAGAFPRRDRAAVLGIVQLALNLALFLAYLRLARLTRGLEKDPAPERRPARARDTAVAVVALAFALLPAFSVLAGGFRVAGRWSLEPWRALVDASHPAHAAGFDIARALFLSLSYGVASCALALALTLLLAYGARRAGGRLRGVAETLAALPLGASSLLVGLGYLLTFGAGGLFDLRGTRLVIVLAHALVAFPFTARVLLPALDLHEARLDEAAALLGAAPREVVRRVHLPLLAAPLLMAGGLAVAISLGDFGASLLLMRPDNMGLAVWIMRIDAPFDPLKKAQAIALTGLLMGLAALAMLAVERVRPPGTVET